MSESTIEETAGATQGEGLDEFRSSIRGGVLADADEGYADACRLWNGMIERRPAVIARCTGNADVIAAVRYARERGLPIGVRGGGHNVSGSALCDGGVVVDLSAMRHVSVDPKRRLARAAGGARLGDLDHETQAFGLAAPVGVVSRTGIAGLTLHGGLGFLTRRLGLTCDHLVAAEVVTADGELVRADREEHSELLWALRGGGGNFGVVTSFEYALDPVGPLIWMLLVFYAVEHAHDVMRALRETMAGAPDELMAIGIFWNAPAEEFIPPEWHGKPVLIAGGCWSGPLEQAEAAVKPLREAAPVVADISGPMPYLVAEQMFDPEYPDGRRYYWKSLYLDAIGDDVTDALVAHSAARPSELSSVDVWTLGGAMQNEPEGGSAFARRNEPFLLGIEANWDDPGDDDANVGWVRDVYRDMGRFSSGATYLNFPGFGEEGEAMLRAAFDGNYARLQAVKARYDPENVFRSNLNISPA